MDKQKRAKIIAQVKHDRAARRAVAHELGLNKVHGKVHLTSKRDLAGKRKNTIRVQELDKS